jgi:DNA adenine methylase
MIEPKSLFQKSPNRRNSQQALLSSQAERKVLADTRISPLLKWPGGKSGELNMILPMLPTRMSQYFEPFLGGGAMFWSIAPDIPAYVNDRSSDLVSFYRSIACAREGFFSLLEELMHNWQDIESLVETNRGQLSRIYTQYRADRLSRLSLIDKVQDFVSANTEQIQNMFPAALDHNSSNFSVELKKNLVSKFERMRHIEEKLGRLPKDDVLNNIEGSMKSAFYMHLRHIYNHSTTYNLQPDHHSAIFFFIREYAYAAMFRFNAQGQFNVPYGGIGYNRKNMSIKINGLKDPTVKARLRTAVLEDRDFMDFLKKYPPRAGDFIFVDPPYDSDFSNYDRNLFSKTDQVRLADYLIKHCKANFMLVIKSTDYILSLYKGHGLNIRSFGKKYMWTIKERNNRDTTHLMITNY